MSIPEKLLEARANEKFTPSIILMIEIVTDTFNAAIHYHEGKVTPGIEPDSLPAVLNDSKWIE